MAAKAFEASKYKLKFMQSEIDKLKSEIKIKDNIIESKNKAIKSLEIKHIPPLNKIEVLAPKNSHANNTNKIAGNPPKSVIDIAAETDRWY